MKKVKIRRIFHPIGQGAFYTEQFDTDEGKLSVVYDCGSLRSGVNKEAMIQTVFKSGDSIDILFISHFDTDHMNFLSDIKKLKIEIKKVVIPLLSSNPIAIKILQVLYPETPNTPDSPNGSNGTFFDNTALKTYLKQFLDKSTEIVTVNPIKKKELSDNDSKIWKSLYAKSESDYISDSNSQIKANESKEKTIESGDVITLTSKKRIDLSGFENRMEIIWKYVPYNFKSDERSKQFIKALKRAGISENCTYDDRTIKKIKKIYASIDGNLNENSMVVFSLPDKREDKFRVNNYYGYSGTNYRKCHSPGCVFMGDFDAKKNLKEGLQQLLNSYYMDKIIGVLQIPHHGSRENYNSELIKPYLFYVISFGNNNQYGHPSCESTSDILKKKGVLILITQCKLFMFTQNICQY
ncbi:MAG: hypothetical protein LBN20_01115 [Endomicrobium sp.]|jgi:hypothetical protein|nr:hypothetical protein [Endomicrobium sp.]